VVMQKLSIVIPCYNERTTVGTLLERVLKVPLPGGWEREIIVVDDASTDGTSDMLAKQNFPIRLIRRTRNGGKGTALLDGFREATGSHFLIQDADLEYDPEDIPLLLNALRPDAAVYGSRYRPDGRRGSKLLRFGVWSLTKLMNFLYGTRLTDVCTCYKLFPREMGTFWQPGRFEPEMLITAELVRQGYQIREVPISYHPRTVAEGKKIKYGDGIRLLATILTDYLAHGRSGIMRGL
jgi:glycosyltransferase involved in cell wall biosynthesis